MTPRISEKSIRDHYYFLTLHIIHSLVIQIHTLVEIIQIGLTILHTKAIDYLKGPEYLA